jgi:pimeloyl-ACP methyl ester carboxylesterase
MGYKGYVNGTEVFTTGMFGGFPCFNGDLFFENLSGFLSSYLPGPFNLSFDFYHNLEFNPPIFAHFNLYYNGSSFSVFDDTTHTAEFSVATSTRVASAHHYISSADVGLGANFKITNSTGDVYISSTIYSTTTGDFYPIWSFPELSPGEYTFYTDLASSTVLTSTTTSISIPDTTPKHSSVLFLPGIKASRLYKTSVTACSLNCEDQLWEPNANSDVEALFMNPDGTSVDDSVYTRDVIDEAYGTINVYKSFLEKFGEMKSDGDIADYSVVPYDWRLSFDDILNSGTKTGNTISYTHETSDPYIISELSRLAASSDNGKVTIIAHSNGGLLAKALLQKLSDTHNPLLAKIDKLILVAVPQLGAPTSITSLLHGYNEHIPPFIPLALTDSVARKFANNMPGAYQLLPSNNYFTYVDTPVVTFGSGMSDWADRYGEVIHSEETLHNFLTDTFGRVESDNSNTHTPTYLQGNLLSASETVHETLDNWSPPSGIQVTEIAGWGIPTTMSGVEYYMDHGQVKFNPVWTIDGDGTVTTPSALWANGNASTTRYWVDEGQYNKDNRPRTFGGIFPFNHGNILEIPQVLSIVKDDFEDQSNSDLPAYLSTSTPDSIRTGTRLVYSLHSPLTLDIFDNLGNHTGISTTTGQIEEQIPGTYFIQIGDVKYIFTGSDTPTNIQMSGYDTGTFTFTIEQMQGDSTVSQVTFQDIPTNPTTHVNMSVSSDIHTLSSLNIDSDNNGIADIILNPVIGDTITYEPPISGVHISSGGNGPIVGGLSVSPANLVPLTTSSSTAITIATSFTSSTTITTKKVALKSIVSAKRSVQEAKPAQASSIEQTAQIVSSDRNYVPRITHGIRGFLNRFVGWSVSLFK